MKFSLSIQTFVTEFVAMASCEASNYIAVGAFMRFNCINCILCEAVDFPASLILSETAASASPRFVVALFFNILLPLSKPFPVC
jgi:hypothetical protein